MKRKPSEAQTALVDGRTLLDDIEATVRRFIYLPSEDAYAVIAAWVLYTHVSHAFDHAPRLFLWSAVPGNGKSTLLRILKRLVRKGDLELNPTEAALFRNIEANHPTLLLDEADKYIHGYNNGIVAILNSGHSKDATVPRNIGSKGDYKLKLFNVFGPVAFAMKGRKPPADLLDRSITIELQKALPDIRLGRFRSAVDEPDLDALRQQTEIWATQNVEQVRVLDPKMPPELQNRIADNWRPLFAVAEIAGGNWPDKLRDAALLLEASRGLGDSGLSLLSNILEVFKARAIPWLSSQSLSDALNENEDWQWGGDYKLTPHSLARRLRPFKIKPAKARPNGITQVRGYSASQFEKVWEQHGIGRGTLGTFEWAKLAKADNPFTKALTQVTY